MPFACYTKGYRVLNATSACCIKGLTLRSGHFCWRTFEFLADLRDNVGGQIKASQLPNRNLVFVVDDDPGMLRAVKRLLRQFGYDSLLFEFAAAFEQHNDFERATCIILDINLNGASGIDLRYRLKDAGVCVPVIYLTGNDKPATRAAAEKSGCLAYLTKPFPAQSLIELLKRASTAFT